MGHTTHVVSCGKTTERTLAWLNHYRCLAIRYERRKALPQTFLDLACALICLKDHAARPVRGMILDTYLHPSGLTGYRPLDDTGGPL